MSIKIDIKTVLTETSALLVKEKDNILKCLEKIISDKVMEIRKKGSNISFGQGQVIIMFEDMIPFLSLNMDDFHSDMNIKTDDKTSFHNFLITEYLRTLDTNLLDMPEIVIESFCDSSAEQIKSHTVYTTKGNKYGWIIYINTYCCGSLIAHIEDLVMKTDRKDMIRFLVDIISEMSKNRRSEGEIKKVIKMTEKVRKINEKTKRKGENIIKNTEKEIDKLIEKKDKEIGKIEKVMEILHDTNNDGEDFTEEDRKEYDEEYKKYKERVKDEKNETKDLFEWYEGEYESIRDEYIDKKGDSIYASKNKNKIDNYIYVNDIWVSDVIKNITNEAVTPKNDPIRYNNYISCINNLFRKYVVRNRLVNDNSLFKTIFSAAMILVWKSFGMDEDFGIKLKPKNIAYLCDPRCKEETINEIERELLKINDYIICSYLNQTIGEST